MKLLQWCVAAAVVAGVAAGPRVVSAQALGEAATLGAGVSSAGSASGSALGNSLGRALRSDGHRVASSSSTSNSGGVVNLHWSQEELKRSARPTRTKTRKNHAKSAGGKPQPDFVIFGADPPDADSGDASASQPKLSRDKGSSSQSKKKSIPASH